MFSTDTGPAKEVAYACFTAAALAQWVYDRSGPDDSPATVPPLSEEVNAKIFIQDKETDTEGAALVTENKVYIVFRGTESFTAGGLKDWSTNIRAHTSANFRNRFLEALRARGVFKLVAYFHLLKDEFGHTEFCGIKAHPGFVAATEAVLQQVVDVLDMYRDREEVIFIGHSLGGALAALTAVAIEHQFRKYRDPRKSALITIGQPKVSRRRQLNLALRFVPYIRIQACADVVPRLPKLWYSHGGDCLYMPKAAVRAAENNKPISKPVIWNPSRMYMFLDRMGVGIGRLTHHSAAVPLKILAWFLK